MGEPTTSEGLERLAYVHHRGNAHYQTWREVNAHDWMIADANKRLEQLRSRLADDNDRVTWRAGCSEAAREVKPELAIRSLERFLEHAGPATLKQLHMVKAELHRDAAEYNAVKTSTERIFNPVQNKITTKVEWLIDTERKLDESLEKAKIDLKVVDQLKDDLERRQK